MIQKTNHFIEIDSSETSPNSKKTEEALINSEEKYRTLYSSMNEGVAIHDVIYNSHNEAIDYVLKDINPAYEKIVGLKKNDVINKTA